MTEYVADFETCKYNNKQRVWLWALRIVSEKLNEKTEIGTNIKSFFKCITTLKQKRFVVFFHNLRFDASYILDYLLKNGFVYADTMPQQLKEKELTVNSTTDGEIYEVAVNVNGKIVRFKDSLKLFNASEQALAISYKLPIKKGEIDYCKPRGEEYKPTKEEIDYIKNDVNIIANILYHFRADGYQGYTASSSAFNEFLKMAFPRNTIKNSLKAFKEKHKITLEDDMKLRHAYLGGYCYLNPKYKGKVIEDGIVLDVNSMYPYIMKTQLMPYGQPMYKEGKPYVTGKYNLFITHIQIDATIKKNCLPVISNRKLYLTEYGSNEYITNTNGAVDIYVTNIDLDLIYKNYNINYINYVESWSFKSQEGGFFGEYIDRFYSMKQKARQEHNEVKAQNAKIFLNGLYGKFGTNPLLMNTKPEVKDDVVRFSKVLHKAQEPLYVPLSIFITSHARKHLLSAIEANYERFVYCDTDSIHLIGKNVPNGIKIHETELGAWKIENKFKKAKYLNLKQYIDEDYSGNLTIRCAGLSTKSQKLITFENFNAGATFTTLSSKRCDGGIELINRQFCIK